MQDLNINITGVNSSSAAESGYQRYCVECSCKEQDRSDLSDNLRTRGAIKIKEYQGN